ncbi:MAG: PAS domain S-box protein [Rhodoferax sp.]|nr:PAS domain S-box protein [Rhodoferax sp.]
MPDPILPSPAPATPPVRHRGIWAWPFVLALTFATTVGAWLQWSDEQEHEEERRTLIADVLTLENRISDWLAGEEAALTALAQRLPLRLDDATLLREPAVVEGLRRMWISVTVIDPDNRLRAHVPPQSPQPPTLAPGSGVDDGNVSAHLSTPTAGGGRLIARFAPTALLRQTVPWWLSRKYDVRLVDEDDQRIASTGDPLPRRGRQSYRVSLEPRMGNAFLELTTREVRKPWWRTLPMALMAAFLLLSAATSWALRRQMREVASAEDRWRTEAAWRRAIENSLTVGLRGRDTEGRLVHVNRAFCDLVGLPPEQLLGQLPPMPYWLPDTLEDHMQRHLRTLAGEAPREGYEARWRHSNGTTLDVMVFEAPLIDAAGQHIGWMGSIVDITERKRSEERERRQLETLGNHARLTTLGEVASALAHQLNQPLAAVAGYNAGVLRSLERSGFADAVVLDAVRRMGEQVAEAGHIVQRIRGFLTRRTPQREACQLNGIVLRALGLLQRDLARRHIRVVTDFADTLPNVLADPILVEQVLINLVRNAADALGDTPSSALAASSAPTIRITVSQAGTQGVRVAVDDNGCGLGGRSVEELTAPFHSTKADGMGMGLAICRSVIEAHHGTLEAGNSDLGGARLSFTLPVDPPQPAP